MDLNKTVLNFFNFIYCNGFEGSICWFENEFHVITSRHGHIVAYGQAATLTKAIDGNRTQIETTLSVRFKNQNENIAGKQ